MWSIMDDNPTNPRVVGEVRAIVLAPGVEHTVMIHPSVKAEEVINLVCGGDEQLAEDCVVGYTFVFECVHPEHLMRIAS